MSTLKVATIQDTSGNNSSTPSEVAQGRAKAWIKFDGTGTISIDKSYNCSSLVDLGTGRFRVVFTTAMSDNLYSVLVTTRYVGSGAFMVGIITGMSTTHFQVASQDLNNTAVDSKIHAVVFTD